MICRSLDLQLELVAGPSCESYGLSTAAHFEQFEARKSEMVYNYGEPDNGDTTCGSESVLGQEANSKSITSDSSRMFWPSNTRSSCGVCWKLCSCDQRPPGRARRSPNSLGNSGLAGGDATLQKGWRLGSEDGSKLS